MTIYLKALKLVKILEIKLLKELREYIEKVDDELERIEKIGYKAAGVRFDDCKHLREGQLERQRDYNVLLDEHPEVSGFARIQVDTFKDRWLRDDREYELLDVVEVDCEKRVKRSSMLFRNVRIGENEKYIMYCISNSFIRKDKKTGQTVFFGKGSIPAYYDRDVQTGKLVVVTDEVSASVYNGWFYWYDDGSTYSDKFIYRRSLDGKTIEKLDWLSNNKTSHAGHIVSEDVVRNMYLSNDKLVIEVYRKSTGTRYNITVCETDNELIVQNEGAQKGSNSQPFVESESCGTRECDMCGKEVEYVNTESEKNMSVPEILDDIILKARNLDSAKKMFEFLSKYEGTVPGIEEYINIAKEYVELERYYGKMPKSVIKKFDTIQAKTNYTVQSSREKIDNSSSTSGDNRFSASNMHDSITEGMGTGSYIYAKAANGMAVRIPKDHYAQWAEGQERIKQGTQTNAEIQKEEELKEGLRKLLQRRD